MEGIYILSSIAIDGQSFTEREGQSLSFCINGSDRGTGQNFFLFLPSRKRKKKNKIIKMKRKTNSKIYCEMSECKLLG
jgi:hypothetical protein